MATPATLNTWLDELSSSILNQKFAPKQNRKKLQDTFRRRVKRHSYGRTNQFEVVGKLDGLEEKFQILTLDNLSDALQQRRIDLKEYEHHWLPDVLDLFLHLSGDPARNSRLLELYRVPPRIGTPPPLRWKDILADDPIDRKDPLWRVPDFRDQSDSGNDDGDSFSSAPSSPLSARKTAEQKHNLGVSRADDILYGAHDGGDVTRTLHELGSWRTTQSTQVTEMQLIREVIFTLRGLPSILFVHEKSNYHFNPTFSVLGIPTAFVHSISNRVVAIRLHIDQIQQWLAEASTHTYIAAMKNATESIFAQFSTMLDKLQEGLINPKEITAVSSISIIDAAEDLSLELIEIARFLATTEGRDSINCLEALYSCVSNSQLFGEPRTYRVLRSILMPSLVTYLQPVWKWIEYGEVNHEEDFFVEAHAARLDLRKIWHEQFTARHSGSARSPAFLNDSLDKVLSCGKTAAFVRHLQMNSPTTPKSGSNQLQFEASLESLASDHYIPFTATFESLWHEHISIVLQQHTVSLKSLLATSCGFIQTFDAIGQIYLGRGSTVLDDIEKKIFNRIDKCIDSWNDRFLIADMLEEAFGVHEPQYLADAVTIHSVYTSSRAMQSTRRSVQILSALTFDYNLSWPVANIIDNASMISYRRIALVLMQIRRAKYCLERTGYLRTLTVSVDEQVSLADQKFAQLLAFMLLNFINTIYDYLATTMISPLTKAMRDNMANASTMDDMIETHQQYINRLESSCLAAPRLKVMRQALITLLDFCIHFSDLVSDSTSTRQNAYDQEAGSFRSAQSRRRTPRLTAPLADSESDDDGELGNAGEGYSSFIVLNNDTTIVKELRKLRGQFKRQLDFFIAGLRGAGRERQHVEDLEGLADRLAWHSVG